MNNTAALIKAARERGQRSYIALPNNKIGVVLTRGYVATIDPDDYAAVSKHVWHAIVKPGGTYAGTTLLTSEGRKSITMHKFLMGKAGVDHIDGNGLNNCRANLRFATHGQNQCNKKSWGNRKQNSPYKGVRMSHGWKPGTKQKKWTAEIRHEKKIYALGSYHCEIEAAKAYDAASLKYHAEFGYRNFPEQGGQ